MKWVHDIVFVFYLSIMRQLILIFCKKKFKMAAYKKNYIRGSSPRGARKHLNNKMAAAWKKQKQKA